MIFLRRTRWLASSINEPRLSINQAVFVFVYNTKSFGVACLRCGPAMDKYNHETSFLSVKPQFSYLSVTQKIHFAMTDPELSQPLALYLASILHYRSN